jgi:hypothetical protein
MCGSRAYNLSVGQATGRGEVRLTASRRRGVGGYEVAVLDIELAGEETSNRFWSRLSRSSLCLQSQCCSHWLNRRNAWRERRRGGTDFVALLLAATSLAECLRLVER